MRGLCPPQPKSLHQDQAKLPTKLMNEETDGQQRRRKQINKHILTH
jgi:hypothetical protein